MSDNFKVYAAYHEMLGNNSDNYRRTHAEALKRAEEMKVELLTLYPEMDLSDIELVRIEFDPRDRNLLMNILNFGAFLSFCGPYADGICSLLQMIPVNAL